MRRSRVPIAEKRVLVSKTKHNSSQQKLMPWDQKVTRKNFSVSMVNIRSAKENNTRGSAEEGRTEPAIEIDLETPDQSVNEVEKKTTKSTPMPNAEEKKAKVDGILTDRHCGGHDGQYAGNHKGRVSKELNVIHREVRHDGWNEIKRHSGGRNEGRER